MKTTSVAPGTFFLLLPIAKQNKGNLCVSSLWFNQSKDGFLCFHQRQEALKSPKQTIWFYCNRAQIAMSENTICTNLIIMLLHKSRDKFTHRKYGQMVYLLCHTFCIFLGTIKKRTSSGMSFPPYVWPEKKIFPEDSSLSSVVTKTRRTLTMEHPWSLPPLVSINYSGSQALPCWLREGRPLWGEAGWGLRRRRRWLLLLHAFLQAPCFSNTDLQLLID